MKNNDNAWLDKEETIRDEIEEYFKSLFTGIGPRDWPEAINAIKLVIS